MKNFCDLKAIPSAKCLLCDNYGNLTCPIFLDDQKSTRSVSSVSSKENHKPNI